MELRVIATSSGRLDRVFSRWGLSFLIGGNLLFDTFSDGKTLLRGMEKMGVNPLDIRSVVISHDHWDHTDGLPALLEKNRNIIIYACPGFGNEFKERVISLGASLMEVSRFFKIKPGIHTTGEISGMYADFFIAEQSLVVDSGDGLSVITGCAHPGIVSIVTAVKKRLKKQVNTIIGGFHLHDKSPDMLTSIIEDLEMLGVKKVYSTYCTGQAADALLRKKFKDNLTILKTGNMLIL